MGLAIGLTLAAAFLFVALLATARQRQPEGESSPPANKTGQAVDRKPTAPNSPKDIALAREIEQAISDGDLAQARLGVFVISLNDGREVYSHNGDKLFTPASNMKIYTTAVALDLLGADYRWRTSVYADKGPDAGGAVDGDLVLYGRGAPDLTSARENGSPSLAELVDQLYQRGVRSVRGNIIGDESYLRSEMYGDGWQWNDLQWYFGAEPSALTVNANSVELTITPANRIGGPAGIGLKRATEYVHLTNNTTMVERGAAVTIGINRELSNNNVRVWGDFPLSGRAFTAYLSVAQPALWAATLFKEALIARGIEVNGEARSRDFRVSEGRQFDLRSATELAHVDSRSLGEIIRETNKESINLYAELLLRTLGKERGQMAPDPDPRKMKQRGDDDAGAAVIKLWLERAGISTDGLSFRDGSGLSRLDLVSPESTVHLLAAVSRTNSFAVFRESLPVSGRDGTLKTRLLHEAGRINAKTGSLTFDHSLSGYATTQSGEVLVFSIFCNDAVRESGAVRGIDRIASLFASY